MGTCYPVLILSHPWKIINGLLLNFGQALGKIVRALSLACRLGRFAACLPLTDAHPSHSRKPFLKKGLDPKNP